jgi:hypothetical protein
MILQMTVKVVNDLARPNKIVLILLLFGLYPRITEIDAPSLTIIKRAEAICAATKEVCRLYTKQQVNNAFAIHNSLNTIVTVDLPLQSDVCV